MVERKTCRGCRKRKPFSEFGRNGFGRDGTVLYRGRCKRCRRKGDAEQSPRIDACPFAAWMRYVMVRDDATRIDLSDRFGIAEKVIRYILNDHQALVELDTVDRALIADGTLTFDDLYPDAILEVA